LAGEVFFADLVPEEKLTVKANTTTARQGGDLDFIWEVYTLEQNRVW